jgi:hypothetical protein
VAIEVIAMFERSVLKHLSYSCGCPLDIREEIAIVNGRCPNHTSNSLLFDGIPIAIYKKLLKKRLEKLDQKEPETV